MFQSLPFTYYRKMHRHQNKIQYVHQTNSAKCIGYSYKHTVCNCVLVLSILPMLFEWNTKALNQKKLFTFCPFFQIQTHSVSPLSLQVNTFQAVIGYDETDSYVLFLYPEGGLNFFGTRPKVKWLQMQKALIHGMIRLHSLLLFLVIHFTLFFCFQESYNVEIELPARVGFSRGEITYLIFSRTEGPHFSVTGDQETVKNLNQ